MRERFTVDVHARGRTIVLTDPAFGLQLDALSDDRFSIAVENAVEVGRAFAFWPGEDGEWHLRLIVGEDPPSELVSLTLKKPGWQVEDCILRVPSGTIGVCGRGNPATELRQQVLPGEYRLSAYHLDRDSAAENAVLEQDGDSCLVVCAEQSCGILGCGGLGLFACGFLSHLLLGWPDFWSLLLLTAVAGGAAILFSFVVSRFPPLQRRARRREQFLQGYPHLVIVIRKLNDGERVTGMTGGCIPTV